MSYLDILEAQLVEDEDKRNRMYKDSLGVETIGIGHNLRERPISDRAVRVIFEDDVAYAEADARRIFPSFDTLTDARKAVLVNMAFNLGAGRLAGFNDLRRAVAVGDWAGAADAMLDSKWAMQVKGRAVRLADSMRKG